VLVSVIIPAFAAERTIARCVESLLVQDYRDWEAIVVSDDRQDYAALLAAAGIADRRLRFLSTGAVRSGAHNARNAGLEAAKGAIIAQLDADDLYDPRRLGALAPFAAAYGAAVDGVVVVSEATGKRLYTASLRGLSRRGLAAPALLDLAVPLFPVVHRAFAAPRLAGVEYADDVVANLQLIERLGPLPVYPRTLYEYRIVPGSLCHADNSGAAFERAYSAYLERLLGGDGLGLVATRAAAQQGLAKKRAGNRLFIDAQRRQPGLTFQEFMTPYRGSTRRALAAQPR
jgi:glycosyltransferase involved in cell wall biosynthesis